MSWQEEYIAKYEDRLVKRWLPDGRMVHWESILNSKLVEAGVKPVREFEHPTMRGVPKLTWSAEEIARTLGLSIQFIRNEMHAGHLLSRKYGRRRLVKTQDLEDYVARGSEGSKTNKDNYSTE